MTDAAIIYRTHVEAIEGLPESEQLKAYKAIVSYCMDDVMPDDMIGRYTVGMAKPLLDKWKAKREAGAKGGSKRKQTEANGSKTKLPEATAKETQPKVKEKEKEKVKDINNNMSGKPDGTYLMPTVQEVVNYLNQKAGTHYRVNVRQTVDKIKARLNDGFTVDDFKKVIDIKTAEWTGTEWQKFIRPETLFGAKFESYLNQKPAQKKSAAGQFANFEQRNDAEHKDMVARLIAMQ